MIKDKMVRLAGLTLLMLSVLTACQGLPTPSALSPLEPPSSPLALPTAAQAIAPLTATPAESSSKPVLAEIPTPGKSDQSTITGFLMVNKESPTPAGDAILYLAAVHTDDTGKPLAVSFDRKTAPRTQVDASGRFVFVDVPSQQYGLILDRISEAFLLNSPDDNSDMLLSPKAGEILDVGRLIYSSLPGAGLLP